MRTWLVVVFALLISWATVRLRYHQIANVLKWLVLVLFAYPITAFVVGTAVINGLLAPFLLAAILVVASDRKRMQGQPSSRLAWTVVAITTVAMFAAGVAMFVV
jgi:Mn2+/Fe2+ NRAMP family transporter